MKKIIILTLFLISTSLCFAQQSNTEFGIRLLTSELIPKYELISNLNFSFYSSKQLGYTQQINTFFNPGNSISKKTELFIDLPVLKSTGVYLPGIFFRKKAFKRFWVRGLIEGYSIQVKSSNPFSFNNGSLSESYTIYDKKAKGINLEYAIQYQWLVTPKLILSSALESEFRYMHVKDKSEGTYNGCFNSGVISNRSYSGISFFGNLKLVNSLSLPIYKKYFITYDLAFPMVEQRLSLSRYL